MLTCEPTTHPSCRLFHCWSASCFDSYILCSSSSYRCQHNVWSRQIGYLDHGFSCSSC